MTESEKQDTTNCWYVYMVLCVDDTIYTGCTNNLEKRVEAHNTGKGARYTRSRGPVKLIWSAKCENRSCAQKRESKIKKLARAKKNELVFSSPKKRLETFLTSEAEASRFIDKP